MRLICTASAAGLSRFSEPNAIVPRKSEQIKQAERATEHKQKRRIDDDNDDPATTMIDAEDDPLSLIRHLRSIPPAIEKGLR